MSETRQHVLATEGTLVNMSGLRIIGIDNDALSRVLGSGIDHGGNAIEPFVDDEGGWPLRCCLQDSQTGDSIAIIAWSPFSWIGPYAETGPIVVHVRGCLGPIADDRLPIELDRRPMTLRPYGLDRRIAYDKVRFVDDHTSLTEHVTDLLRYPEIMEVHGRNVTGGCYSFMASRAP